MALSFKKYLKEYVGFSDPHPSTLGDLRQRMLNIIRQSRPLSQRMAGRYKE